MITVINQVNNTPVLTACQVGLWGRSYSVSSSWLTISRMVSNPDCQNS